MNPVLNLLDLLSQPIWQNLVFALLHTIWLGALAAITVYLFLRCVPARHTQARYLFTIGAQLAVLAGGFGAWAVLNHRADQAVAITSPLKAPLILSRDGDVNATTVDLDFIVSETGTAATLQEPAAAGGVTDTAPTSGSATWTAWMMIVWFTGVAWMLTRALVAVARVRGLAQGPRVTDEATLATIERLRQELRITRPVRVVVTETLGSPAVMGIFWPTILMPAAMLTGVSPESLRAILAHELGHIRRHDYLVNLIQMVVESLLFFNPAVWWIGRQARAEREACCDALAVAMTGEPIEYTRVLADWSERLSRPDTVDMPPNRELWEHRHSAAVAWNGGSTGKPLLDRVRRVLVPNHRPDVTVSWSGLIALLVVAPLMSLMLWRGSTVAVAFAAQLLTPSERIERMNEIAQTHGKVSATEATPPGKFTVAGRVRMQDGAPLPDESFFVVGTLLRKGYGATIDLKLDEAGNFEQEIDSGTLFLHARLPDHALSLVGPIEGQPGERIDDVDLVISRGFTTSIRFVDEQGVPIAGVLLERAGYRFSAGTASSGFAHPMQAEQLRSDDDGLVTLSRCTDWQLEMDVRRSGFQFDRERLTLVPDEVHSWTLAVARPTVGTVTGADGAAVTGASLYLAGREGPLRSHGGDPRADSNKPLLALSDSQGRFSLDTLRDDSRYLLFVKAEGHGVQLVREVIAGQSDLDIVLGPELTIRGHLIGRLDELPRLHREPKPHFQYRNVIELQRDVRYSALFRAPVDIEDGSGTFEITDLFPGRVELNLPGRTVRLDLREPIDDLKIDLTEPQDDTAIENRPKRRVVVNFDLPPDAPAPRGELRIGYSLQPLGMSGFHDHRVEADSERIEMEVPVGSQFFYDGEGLLGYRIANRSVDVPAGDEPLKLTVPVHPAGAVYGRVLAADGSPARGSVHLITVDMPEAAGTRPMDSVSLDRGDGRFAFTTIPLDGRYRLLAREEGSQARVLSEILTLDAEQPLHEVQLQFATGEPLRVTVLDPQGNPVSGARVEFGYASPHRTSYGDAGATTDARGLAVFERVNPNLPGTYSVTVRPTETLQGRHLRLEHPDKPLSIRLKRGMILAGTLVDADARPLADVRISTQLADARNVQYGLPIETVSGADGQFEFRNLEPTIYRLNVSVGTVTEITPPIDDPVFSRKPVARAGQQPVTVVVELINEG